MVGMEFGISNSLNDNNLKINLKKIIRNLMKNKIDINSTTRKTTTSSNLIEKNTPFSHCFSKIFQMCYSSSDEFDSQASLEKFKGKKLPSHYASSIKISFPKFADIEEEKIEDPPEKLLTTRKKSFPPSFKHGFMMLTNPSFSLLSSLSKIYFELKRKNIENLSFEKNRATIRNEKVLKQSIDKLSYSVNPELSDNPKIEKKTENIRKKVVQRVGGRVRSKGMMLSVGNDDGITALEFAKEGFNVISLEKPSLKMDDYLSFYNLDFIFSNFYLEKKLKSDFIFISPTIIPYFEVKEKIVYDECDVGLNNFFEEIDKLLIRSLEIAPNVIFYLQKFNNLEELGSLFGKYFQDFHDSKPIHDSIDIELIYANNIMEGVLIYYGKDLVKNSQGEKCKFLISEILKKDVSSPDKEGILKNLISKLGNFQVCQILNKMSKHCISFTFQNFINYCHENDYIKQNCLFEMTSFQKEEKSGPFVKEFTSFSFNPFKEITSTQKETSPSPLKDNGQDNTSVLTVHSFYSGEVDSYQ